MKKTILFIVTMLFVSSCTYYQHGSVGRFEYTIPLQMTEKPDSVMKKDAHRYYQNDTALIQLWVNAEIHWEESEKIRTHDALLERTNVENAEEIKTEITRKDDMIICLRVFDNGRQYVSFMAVTNGDYSVFFKFNSANRLSDETLSNLANSVIFR